MSLHNQIQEPSVIGWERGLEGARRALGLQLCGQLCPLGRQQVAQKRPPGTLFEKCCHSLDPQQDPILGPNRKRSSRRLRVKKRRRRILFKKPVRQFLKKNTKGMFRAFPPRNNKIKGFKRWLVTHTHSLWEEPPGAPGRAPLPLAASLGGGKAGWDGTGRVINRVVCQALAGPSYPSPLLALQLLQEEVKAVTAKTECAPSSRTQSRSPGPGRPVVSVASACACRWPRPGPEGPPGGPHLQTILEEDSEAPRGPHAGRSLGPRVPSWDRPLPSPFLRWIVT